MNTIRNRALAGLACAALLAGCGSEGVLPDEQEGKTQAEVVDKSGTAVAANSERTEGASTSALPPVSQGFQGHPLDDPDSLLQKRVIYFDYDSASIRAEDRAALEAHAEYMASNFNASVTLEGHADERGSREYNIALGERRAQSVRRLLTLLGVSDGQVRAVSFGEERPAALGHDEASWWQNRRVELNYER